MVRSEKVISSMRNNDGVGRNNEVGIFRALQVEQSSLSDEWEIMTESEVEVKLSRALNSSKAAQNYPISHGQLSNTFDEISNKMNNFFKSVCA